MLFKFISIFKLAFGYNHSNLDCGRNLHYRSCPKHLSKSKAVGSWHNELHGDDTGAWYAFWKFKIPFKWRDPPHPQINRQWHKSDDALQ